MWTGGSILEPVEIFQDAGHVIYREKAMELHALALEFCKSVAGGLRLRVERR